MNALLVIAHGSPRPEANRDVLAVAEEVRARGVFSFVLTCYLDCNQPDISAGVDLCVDAGASEIVAVPYLLHSGKHFVRDLPRILQESARRHPGTRIRMGNYIGREPRMLDVLRDRVAEADR